MTLQEMMRSIEDDLKRVEEAILGHLDSDVSFISETAQYVLTSGGKRIRPVLLILCARLCNTNGSSSGQRLYDLSTVIEFIHTATLLHDDVIDNADLRRGNPTVHSLWGNELSILLGDYLYSKAMALALADKDHLVMKTVSEVTIAMSKGQVIETLKLRNLTLQEDEYYRIIALKTASLFSASCTIGALIAGVSPQQRARVSAFGHHLGMAFQMADDTLDFVAAEAKLGKPVNNDLKEGKITLPIIAVMQQASPQESRCIEEYVRSDKPTDADLAEVLALIHKYNTLETTMARAQDHVQQAKQQLADFPSSPTRDTLYTLADYVIARDV